MLNEDFEVRPVLCILSMGDDVMIILFYHKIVTQGTTSLFLPVKFLLYI